MAIVLVLVMELFLGECFTANLPVFWLLQTQVDPTDMLAVTSVIGADTGGPHRHAGHIVELK